MKKFEKAMIRCKEHRVKILDLSQKVQALHVGGAFSSVEIVDTVYNLLKKKNDKFILSKGHAGIIQYVVLNQLGIISKRNLNSYCQRNGYLGVHPDYGKSGIMASTGSLGHGLGIASGMALANRAKKNFYVLMSDGELQEGSVWEAALIIGALNLKNIIVIIDNNDLQSSTRASVTHPNLYPIEEKFKNFGWDVDSCNGNSSEEVFYKIANRKKDKPFALVAKTIKGYPISFMKDIPMWHYRSPNNKEYKIALNELESL
jgi:transketolase